MLIISRALRRSEPAWELVNVTSVHTGANPIVVAPGTDIWVPPFPCLVRGFIINDDAADPLVGGGTLNIGINTSDGSTNGGLVFARAVASSAYGSRLIGWGIEGPGIVVATGIGVGDSGVILGPVGSFPGRPTFFRHINATGSVAALTGTLRFHFEMRRLAGALA